MFLSASIRVSASKQILNQAEWRRGPKSQRRQPPHSVIENRQQSNTEFRPSPKKKPKNALLDFLETQKTPMKWGEISKNTSRTKSAVFSEDSRKILKFSITLIVQFHANHADNAMKEFLYFS